MSIEPPVSEGAPSGQFFETRVWTRRDPRHRPPHDPDRLDRLLNRTLLTLFEPFRVDKAYDPHLESLDKWWVEFPLEYDEVWREIGFDESGRPVLAGPSRRNWGMWGDTGITLADLERLDPTLTEVGANAFEKAWEAYMKSSGDGPSV